MSPDLAFPLTLALRMAITAAFVVSASFITERSGPVIGALVATLPISAGPSYVFLAIDHDAAFIAQGALASLPINAATIFLGLAYVLLAQRHGALVSWAGGAVVWLTLAVATRKVEWTLAEGLLANAIAFAICIPAMQHFRHVKMPPITRRWYDVPLRASLVAALVATVVTLSRWVGPSVSGRTSNGCFSNNSSTSACAVFVLKLPTLTKMARCAGSSGFARISSETMPRLFWRKPTLW